MSQTVPLILRSKKASTSLCKSVSSEGWTPAQSHRYRFEMLCFTADLIVLQVSCRPSRRVDLLFCSAAAVGVLSRAQRCGFAAGFAGHAISK